MSKRHKKIIPIRNFKIPEDEVLSIVDRATLESLPSELIYESPYSFFAVTEDGVFHCPKGEPETLKVKALTVNPEQPVVQLDVKGLRQIAAQNNRPILETDLHLWILGMGNYVFVAEKGRKK